MVVAPMGRRVLELDLDGRWSAVTCLRVAFLLEQPWHRVPGGTAVAAVESARALAERDDVDLLGITARHRSADPPPLLCGPGSPDYLPLVSSVLPRSLLYEAWHRLGRPRVDRLGRRPGWAPDVVHASGGAVPATHLGLFLGAW